MLPVEPVGARIIIELDPPEKFYKNSCIEIPDAYQTPSRNATVIAVGTGKFNKKGSRIPLGVKVGERVQLGPYSGQEFLFEGNEYHFITEEYIEGILEVEKLDPVVAFERKHFPDVFDAEGQRINK
jgi:chaperonin GroES